MLLAHSLLALAVQTGTTERLDDNSDWWSAYNAPESDATANTQAREVSSSNFEVLGIHLADGMFSQAAAKLRAATIIERGDASTGRQQACYVSAQDGTKVHLIFERGEVDFTYYLFVDGPDWDGSDRCVRTNLISRSPVYTSDRGLSGDRNPRSAQPSRQGRTHLFVKRQEKNSPEELRRLRENSPQLSDRDFHNNYDFYDLGAAFFAKFVDSKLTYFSASTGKTY